MTEDQRTFMGGDDASVESTSIEAAIDFLRQRGYRIQEPIVVDASINTRKDLINYFYRRLDSKYPSRRLSMAPNYSLDMQVMARLVKARMDTGLGEQAAIQECIRIIDAIFTHEKEFSFKYPIRDTRILGQVKLGWVTSKALAIIEDKQRDAEHELIRKRAEEVEFSVEKSDEEVESGLDALLKSMEENN